MTVAVDKNVHDVKGAEAISSVKVSDAKSAKKAKAALMGTLKSAVKSAEKPAPKKPLKNGDESIADMLKGIENHDDCLMELMMAGIEVTQSKNEEVDATSNMGVTLSAAATKVSTYEAQTISDYYKYGAPGGDIGELHIQCVNAIDEREAQYKLQKNSDGTIHIMYRSVSDDGGNDTVNNDWSDGGKADLDSNGNLVALPAGQGSVSPDWQSKIGALNSKNLGTVASTTAHGWKDSFVSDNSAGIIHGGSANQTQMMSVMTDLQSTASEVNNAMGNVAGIPGTELQQLTQAVTTAQQSAQTANQTQQAIANQASTLASI